MKGALMETEGPLRRWNQSRDLRDLISEPGLSKGHEGELSLSQGCL